MKRLLFLLGLAALVLVVLIFYFRSRLTHAQATQSGATACCSAPNEGPRELDFPYYSLRDGYHSTLNLVSDSPKPMDLTVAIRSLTGETLLSPLGI